MNEPHPRWTLTAAGLTLAWTAVYGPLLPWVAAGWTTGDGLLQGLVAGGLVASALHRAPWRSFSLGIRPPHLHIPALLLLLGASLLGAWARHQLPLETVRAIAGTGAAYALLGLYLPPERWRALRAHAALALLLLPITAHLDVLLGWPLRTLTASAAATALSLLGSEPLATETVLRVEGGIAHIDLPCAGVRSLWSGAVGLLLITIQLRRPLDLPWLLVAGLAAGCLLLANILRVSALVALDHVLGWPVVAEIVHQPLGILGFIVSGLLAGGLLWLLPDPRPRAALPRPARWLPLLLLPLLLFGLGRDLPATEALAPLPTPQMAEPLEASPAELAFAAEHGATLVKARVPGGTVVLVSSRSWLAHHVPEMCLQAAGFQVTGGHPAWIDAQPVRVASAHRDGATFTALWWLQSETTLTDDHVVRIRDGLRSDRPWVLVSLLLDRDTDPHDPQLTDLVRTLRQRVAGTLEG